jgi:pyridoxamine 5'-phosphate oxidase
MVAHVSSDSGGTDPLVLFRRWLEEAVRAGVPEPHATTLATATVDGRPSARVVLLKQCDERGFLFATNYESRKGAELAENPRAALVFHWQALERQVRIEGRIVRGTGAESDAIFEHRPRPARIGAWVSPQSREIDDAETLERRFRELDGQYGEEVPRPPFWGAYRLVPERIEFWTGREHRLHERLCHVRQETGEWRVLRLAP